MAYSPEIRTEVTALVALEITQHRSGDIAKFTTYTALKDKYGVSKDTLRSWVKAAIPNEDIQYRTRTITHNLGDHIPPETRSRVACDHSKIMRENYKGKRRALQEYLGPEEFEGPDDLVDIGDIVEEFL